MPIDFSNIKIPFIEYEQLWKIADDVRSKFWNNTIPVDVDLIAEKGLNMQLTPCNSLKLFVHTEAFLVGTLDEILVDLTSPEVRIRFSLAEEIGHKILHPNQIKLLRVKSFDDWKNILIELPTSIWSRADHQAKEFAGRLLVPKPDLIQTIKDYTPQIKKAKQEMPDLNKDDLNPFLAGSIAKRFKVSDNVISIRLKSEKINPIEICGL